MSITQSGRFRGKTTQCFGGFFKQNITSYCYLLLPKILSNVCMAKNLIIYHIFQLLKVNLIRIIFCITYS